MLVLKFKSITDLMTAFPDEDSCLDHLENIRWKDGITSPFDPESKVYKCKNHRYKCKNTGKYFNVKTNTLFEGTRIPLQKWFIATWMFLTHKKGVPSCQLARDLGVTQKTAWFMLHRIRLCFSFENDSELDNEVEVDETFVGGKNKNRHRDKKVKKCQGRSFKDKTPVIGMIERGGKAVAKVIKDTSKESLTPVILNTVNTNAKLYSDEWMGYNRGKEIYDHDFVDHGKGIYVTGNVYTNTVEGFWSMIKRGIIGVYHYTSRKHLQKYVDEFVFRRNTRHMSQSDVFMYFIQNISHKLTYKELVA